MLDTAAWNHVDHTRDVTLCSVFVGDCFFVILGRLSWFTLGSLGARVFCYVRHRSQSIRSHSIGHSHYTSVFSAVFLPSPPCRDPVLTSAHSNVRVVSRVSSLRVVVIRLSVLCCFALLSLFLSLSLSFCSFFLESLCQFQHFDTTRLFVFLSSFVPESFLSRSPFRSFFVSRYWRQQF